jgi:ubiquinone/menaquinone biosynthesis C-methylase UbiE
MTQDAQFWNRIAPGYAKRPVGNPAAYEETLSRTRTYLSAEDHVLELGCGTGTTALKLAPHIGHIEGTDFSEAMIGIARDKAAAGGYDNVSFRVAGAVETGEEPLDAVIAFNLLHLVPDIAAVAKQAHRALKPGGYFITKSVCLGESAIPFRLLITPMQWIGKAPFVHFLKFAELEGTIRDAGFEILETGDYPARPPNHFIVARKL